MAEQLHMLEDVGGPAAVVDPFGSSRANLARKAKIREQVTFTPTARVV